MSFSNSQGTAVPSSVSGLLKTGYQKGDRGEIYRHPRSRLDFEGFVATQAEIYYFNSYACQYCPHKSPFVYEKDGFETGFLTLSPEFLANYNPLKVENRADIFTAHFPESFRIRISEKECGLLFEKLLEKTTQAIGEAPNINMQLAEDKFLSFFRTQTTGITGFPHRTANFIVKLYLMSDYKGMKIYAYNIAYGVEAMNIYFNVDHTNKVQFS